MRNSAFKKGASEYYSGEKKRYTLKVQIVINYHTAEILSVDFRGERTHDFKLFKQSELRLSEHTLVIADKGYQGIKKIHEKSIHQIKRRKKIPINDIQKRYNRILSRLRFVIKRVSGILKHFRIVSTRYRNTPKNFIKTFFIICGLYNFQCHI